MRKLIPIFAALLAGLLLFEAWQTATFTPLVKQELEKLVAEFRQDQAELCKKRALEKASLEVDSLILVWAKANRDTFDRPPKPVKPEEPIRLTPKDTTPVGPLFK